MRRIRTAAVALFTVLTMAVSSGAGPARADTTGFGFEFDEPGAPQFVGSCNSLYCTSFPYGAWSPTWELRVYPAPGGTPTPVQVQWMVGEVKPTDPKHLVAGIDLQIDMGHGWQEVPDGPTPTVTVPATATYRSPYIFYFRFKPIIDAQQAVRICATLLWKGAPSQYQGGQWGTNSCTDDLGFTGTPPQTQPTSAPSAAHTSTTSPGRPTTPARSAATSTSTQAPTPTTTTSTQPATPTTTAEPIPTTTTSPAEPSPTPSPSLTAPAAAQAAPASRSSSAWIAVMLGIIGIVIAGGAAVTVVTRRRRNRA